MSDWVTGDTASQQDDGIQRCLNACVANRDTMIVGPRRGGWDVWTQKPAAGGFSMWGGGWSGYMGELLSSTPYRLPNSGGLSGAVFNCKGLQPGQAMFDVRTTDSVFVRGVMFYYQPVQPGAGVIAFRLRPPSDNHTNYGSVFEDVLSYGFPVHFDFQNVTATKFWNIHQIMHEDTGTVFSGVGPEPNFKLGGDLSVMGGACHTGGERAQQHFLVRGLGIVFGGGLKMQPCGYTPLSLGYGIHYLPDNGVQIEPAQVADITGEGLKFCVRVDGANGGTISELGIEIAQLWAGRTALWVGNSRGGSARVCSVLNLTGCRLMSTGGNDIVAIDLVDEFNGNDNSFDSFLGVPCKGVRTGRITNYKLRADTNNFAPCVTP